MTVRLLVIGLISMLLACAEPSHSPTITPIPAISPEEVIAEVQTTLGKSGCSWVVIQMAKWTAEPVGDGRWKVDGKLNGQWLYFERTRSITPDGTALPLGCGRR